MSVPEHEAFHSAVVDCVVVYDVLRYITADIVELRRRCNCRHVVYVVDAVELRGILVTVRSENRLFKVDVLCGHIRLVITESAVPAAELSYVGVLIVVVLQRFAAEGTEASLGSLEYLLCGKGIGLCVEVSHVLVIGVRPSETSGIRIVAVEDEITGESLAEAVYLLYEGFHFAVAVELVTEEIQHYQCFKLLL